MSISSIEVFPRYCIDFIHRLLFQFLNQFIQINLSKIFNTITLLFAAPIWCVILDKELIRRTYLPDEVLFLSAYNRRQILWTQIELQLAVKGTACDTVVDRQEKSNRLADRALPSQVRGVRGSVPLLYIKNSIYV